MSPWPLGAARRAVRRGHRCRRSRIKAGYSGVLPSVLSEQFPVETRAVGVAFSFSVSVTIFGGFAPFTATWLIAQTGDPLSPAYYLMATALLSIIALMVIARRGPAGGRSRPRQ